MDDVCGLVNYHVRNIEMGIWNVKKVIEMLGPLRDIPLRDVQNDASWIWEEGMEYAMGVERDLTTVEEKRLQNMIHRIGAGEPVQYVIGHTWFYGLKFLTTPAVLIPRPETEELVNWILTDVKNERRSLRILDIGTGSGCIALTLKYHLGDKASITAMDISSEALQVASRNAEQLDVNIDLIACDFLTDGLHGLGRWDIIVSNPPYISREFVESMHHEIKHEPAIALYPPLHPDQFYKLMGNDLPAFLHPGGSCYFEMNEFRTTEIISCFQNALWEKIETKKDMQDKVRMLKAHGKRN